MIRDELVIAENRTIPAGLFIYLPEYLEYAPERWYEEFGGAKELVLVAKVSGFGQLDGQVRLYSMLGFPPGGGVPTWFYTSMLAFSASNIREHTTLGDPFEIYATINIEQALKYPVAGQEFSAVRFALGTYPTYQAFKLIKLSLMPLEAYNWNDGLRQNYPARLS